MSTPLQTYGQFTATMRSTLFRQVAYCSCRHPPTVEYDSRRRSYGNRPRAVFQPILRVPHPIAITSPMASRTSPRVGSQQHYASNAAHDKRAALLFPGSKAST
jgi:hypothetical protein